MDDLRDTQYNLPIGTDCISRQAAIEAVVFECGEWMGLASEISKQLRRLPSAEPKRGKWVKHKSTGYLMCDQCKDVYIDPEWLADGHWNFCPNCGADMRGERNEP